MELKVDGQTVLIDDEDYAIVGGRVLCINRDGYVVLWYEGQTVSLHSLIMKPPANRTVDHWDHNKLNNRKSNLRIRTRQQNQYNTTAQKKNSLGRGISFDKRRSKYKVQLGKNHQVYFGGYFDTLEDATTVRNELARKLYGEFANVG